MNHRCPINVKEERYNLTLFYKIGVKVGWELAYNGANRLNPSRPMDESKPYIFFTNSSIIV